MHRPDPFAELTGLYALGALTAAERKAFETHMAGCVECAAEVRGFGTVADALAQIGTPAEPSPAVRARLLAAIGSQPSAHATLSTGSTMSRTHVSFHVGWLAAAASLVVAVGLGVYALQLRGRVTALESALADASLRATTNERLVADARREAGEARVTLAVLTAPDMARIDLAGQPAAPSATARAFWSRSRGLMFTASNLPALPPGRIYQLWVLSKQPAPTSAGLLTPDAQGRVNAMFDTPQDLPQPVAMAVTLEPAGGVPSPTGDKYLVGLAN